MIIYFAGHSGQQIREEMWGSLIDNRLFSHFFMEIPKLEVYTMRERPVTLFLDSGAYSAFTQGVEIDIDDYIAFIKKHKKYFQVYANLDVIGDPRATWVNQCIMEGAGLKPLPCFHFGEDEKWLRKYLRTHDYIALGGMAGGQGSQLFPWLDRLFREYLTDDKGMPTVKVHGFGMTALRLLLRYPWYSVDSTSWVVMGRVGSIFVPKKKKGKWQYLIDPWKVTVSDRSPTKGDAGKHFQTFSQMQQDVIQEYFDVMGYVIGKSSFRKESEDYKPREGERWHGKPKNGRRVLERIVAPGLCNDYKLRDELNIHYFLKLEKAFPEWPYPFEGTGLGGLF